jgi:hypothetical protein
MAEIMKLLGTQAEADPCAVMGDVLLAATLYLDLSSQYVDAPTRKKLHEGLKLLRKSAGTVAGMLERGEPYLLAALNMHGVPQEQLKSESQTLNILWGLSISAHGALSNLQLTGPASGQKAATWPPKRALAFQCLEIFDRYRPGEASSTEGGPFRTFVSYVYEIATGERTADLESPVKEVLKLVRENGLPAPETPFTDIVNPHHKFIRDLKKLLPQ